MKSEDKYKKDIIIIIPARSGSKRIRNKNIIDVAGIPLIEYTLRQALGSKYAKEIYVTTDCPETRNICMRLGIEVIDRPDEISCDKSTSESALIHALDVRKQRGKKDPDYVVFMQCTSPVRNHDDIDNSIRKIIDEEADSLLSVTDTKRFVWKNEDNIPASINYDYRDRLREQDMQSMYQENGSIYITKTTALRSSGNRLCGKITFYLMDYWCSFQIDEDDDIALINWILTNKLNGESNIINPKNIEFIVLDFDGVFTDNTLYVDQDGRESVRVSRSDGLGISNLKKAGFRLCVLSTEKNPVVEARCRKLDVECFSGVDDKKSFLAEQLGQKGMLPDRVLYLGNDMNDFECMKFVGYPVAVADSHPNILGIAKYILKQKGGDNAIRELSELLLA